MRAIREDVACLVLGVGPLRHQSGGGPPVRLILGGRIDDVISGGAAARHRVHVAVRVLGIAGKCHIDTTPLLDAPRQRSVGVTITHSVRWPVTFIVVLS